MLLRKLYSIFDQVERPTLVTVMQKLIEVGMTGDANEKEKARDAEALQGQIFNIKFVVSLSFLTDVYNTFGFGVNCLQVRSAEGF